jgi:hypothetical protein
MLLLLSKGLLLSAPAPAAELGLPWSAWHAAAAADAAAGVATLLKMLMASSSLRSLWQCKCKQGSSHTMVTALRLEKVGSRYVKRTQGLHAKHQQFCGPHSHVCT